MKKIVVKIGSSVIAPNGKLDRSLIGAIVKDTLKLKEKDYKIILVSSGAIACAVSKLGLKRKPQDTHSLMALASLGQISLMDVYQDKFKKHKRLCAQILLTWDDFDERRRFLNARHTINQLFSMGVVPIINENDAVSFEEIRFGDNDRLSALVADLIGADLLIMLSDIDGLLKGKEVVEVVTRIDNEVLSLAKKEDKAFTAGGMVTKLEAARIATSSGIKTVIARGAVKKVISRIIGGERIGTTFLAQEKVGAARKRWIAFSKKIRGRIYIDQGAKEAILNKGKSLLSVGITKVEGEFKKLDSVEVCDADGNSLGCGLIAYPAEEIRKSCGRPLSREVIHRDNFVRGS